MPTKARKVSEKVGKDGLTGMRPAYSQAATAMTMEQDAQRQGMLRPFLKGDGEARRRCRHGGMAQPFSGRGHRLGLAVAVTRAGGL